MIRNFEEVRFEDIAYSDTSCRVTFRRVPPLLRVSVREIGVLNPLIVSETALPERYAIVTGWLRFQAAREVGENSVPCHIYRSFPPKILLLCSLFDNLGHRVLNQVETAITLQKLGEFYSREELKRTFLPVLGIAAPPDDWSDLQALAELPEEMKWAVANGELVAEAARSIATIPGGHPQHVRKVLAALCGDPAQQAWIAGAFAELYTKDQTPAEIIDEEGWDNLIPCGDPEDPAIKAEEDLLKLEVGLAAPPSLFSTRRAGSRAGHNTLVPGEMPMPVAVQEYPVRKKRRTVAKKAKVVHDPAEFGKLVQAALDRRLGRKPLSAKAALPAGARVLDGYGKSKGSHKLEVCFANPVELRGILKQVLDAEERGAIAEILGRR